MADRSLSSQNYLEINDIKLISVMWRHATNYLACYNDVISLLRSLFTNAFYAYVFLLLLFNIWIAVCYRCRSPILYLVSERMKCFLSSAWICYRCGGLPWGLVGHPEGVTIRPSSTGFIIIVVVAVTAKCLIDVFLSLWVDNKQWVTLTC